MGDRRRAHARAGVTEAGVPRELFDVDSHHWRSEAACMAWLSKRGVRAPSSLSHGDWNSRSALKSVITSWAVASGYSHPDFPRLPDQRFMVASGLATVQQDCTRQRFRNLNE